LVNINLASTHAAQRPAEAANGEEPQYANLRGYHEPIRSASFRTGVNKIMTRFVWKDSPTMLKKALAYLKNPPGKALGLCDSEKEKVR
jgi:hypothetical protein